MKLPAFLIIGAARSGTTSLYRDLDTHPGVFFPVTKEPGNLLADDVLSDTGRRGYAEIFKKAAPDQVCGDATTLYTHRPDHEGVPERALQVLGPSVRLIYIVRHPLDKIISTHHLYSSRGMVSPDINAAVRDYPGLINHACYAMQLEPWREVFGFEQIRVVRFETYIQERKRIVGELESFLGLDARPDLVEVDRAFNRSSDDTVPKGMFAGVIRNRLYRRFLRPLLSADFRTAVRRLVLPAMPERPPEPTAETVAYIYDCLAADIARQPQVFGVPDVFWEWTDSQFHSEAR